jgi:hypothetical protein
MKPKNVDVGCFNNDGAITVKRFSTPYFNAVFTVSYFTTSSTSQKSTASKYGIKPPKFLLILRRFSCRIWMPYFISTTNNHRIELLTMAAAQNAIIPPPLSFNKPPHRPYRPPRVISQSLPDAGD